MDAAGLSVGVGTKVRVLGVTKVLKEVLPADEWQELQAMVGNVFRVSEVDEHGAAWVDTPLVPKGDFTHGHSLALDPHEMAVVPRSRRRRPTRG